jgi:branched-chain amino acid transport system ATP-binding protein
MAAFTWIRDMNPALELLGITKRFGETEMLRGIDLTIPQGERHALIGPNGAGKSTLFGLVSGHMQATNGQIVLNGIDVTLMPAHRRSRSGLARSFQTTSVFEALSVHDNIRCAVLGSPMATRMDRWLRSRALDRETDRIVDAIGLAAHRDTRAGMLGYADQRGLDLGLALACGATVLLLDEPTAGMSRAEGARMLDLIRETTKGKTLLMVEHDMDAVFALADRISVLVRGVLVATGTPDEIRSNPAVRAAYLGEPQ